MRTTNNNELIRLPGLGQLSQTLLTFILAMLLANALLLLLESQLGLYSYFAAQPIQILQSPYLWFCQALSR